MNDDGSGLEQCSELIEVIKRFPTAAFVAGRLKEEGCKSDYRKSVLDEFRDDLVQECGDELFKILEYFRLVSFKSPSRRLWRHVPERDRAIAVIRNYPASVLGAGLLAQRTISSRLICLLHSAPGIQAKG